MAVGGVSGPVGPRFEATSAPETVQAQHAAAEQATVTRTPTSARPDPARIAGRGPGSDVAPLRGNAGDFLTIQLERDVYAFVVGAERSITDILDRMDKLSPASYNRVLHAFGLTRSSAEASLLDTLVRRGASEPGKAKLAQRFFTQLECKLAGQPGRILEHLSADTRDRLERQPGWGRIAGLL